MTTCDDVRLKLSALLDNELPEEEATEVCEHLQSCEACGQQWRSLQSLDDQLKDLLEIEDVPRRIANIQQAAKVQLAQRYFGGRSRWRWATIIAAVAATILIAFIATRPGKEPAPKVTSPTIVASLVRATGPIEVLPPDSDRWTAVDPAENYSIPEGARVRTGEGVLCELKTTEQGKIRLNESAEVVVHDSQKIELRKGQLWCLAPKQAGIEIEIPLQDVPSPKIATMACPSTAEIQCIAGDSFAACDSVSPQNQQANWTLGNFTCPVNPGETVAIDAKQKVDRKIDPNAAKKIWQLPLLAVGNRVDNEFIQSMTSLLAPIGMTKARHLNEQQIRSLGPRGALPLLAYVDSESSPDQLSLRRTAINIAADLADESAIELFQKITSDPDMYISRRADEALKKIAAEAN